MAIKVKAPKAKPKLNVTNIKSPIGQLGGGVGSPVGKKFKSSTLSNQFTNQPVLQAPKIDKSPVNTNPIAGVSQTLAETNSILVEIQNQLALDFGHRIATEQDQIKKLKSDKNKARQAKAAGGSGGSLTAVGAMFGPKGAAIGAAADLVTTAFGPLISIFKKIAGFFTLVAAGFIANQGLDWLTNNWSKVAGFFDFMGEHGHKILMGLTFGLAGLLGVKLYKAFRSLIKFGKWVGKGLHRAFRLARVFIMRTLPNLFKNAVKAISNGLKAIGKAGKGLFSGIMNLGKGLFKGSSKKVATKTGSKVVAKVATKAVGKGVGKSVLKKIPVVGLGLGAIFAIDRLRKGDWGGALMELGSGAASMIPGAGTALSVGIDAALVGKDIHDAKKGDNTGEVSTSATLSSSPKSADLGPVDTGGGIVPFPTLETGASGGDSTVANAGSGGDSIDSLDPDDLGNFYIDFSRDTYGVVA